MDGFPMIEDKKRHRVARDLKSGKPGAEQLSRAIGLLIQAQEQEREQIAQKLHDEIGSSLSILGIELLSAGPAVSDSSRRRPLDFRDMYNRVQEIGSQISYISNQLRPPMLRYFGLAKAIETECSEFSKSCKISATCSCNNVPAKLAPVIALNYFRVVQEALRNSGKHSHANAITVDLTATPTELILTVTDDGNGFNAEQPNTAAGLGLIIMRERMRLIGGEAEIWSQPGQGTKVSCRAPLVPRL